jgi:hypothetical protein
VRDFLRAQYCSQDTAGCALPDGTRYICDALQYKVCMLLVGLRLAVILKRSSAADRLVCQEVHHNHEFALPNGLNGPCVDCVCVH